MKRVMPRFVPLFLLLLWSTSAPAQNWAGALLRSHNSERARWNVAPLAWDPGLARAADGYAAELARTNNWVHSPRQFRMGQGENLWMGTAGAYSLQTMVGAWLAERRWFRPSVLPAVSATGRWNDVGHYTQVIARRTTRVGCGVRSNRRWTYLVCRYSPAGNVDGRPSP